MATRYQTVTQLTAQSALDLTKRRGNWTRFLETAAKLYKYPFPDQLAIYAQRPDATACAPLELWNKSFGRFVRRGSKGIALLDDSGQYPRLKFVFDAADTEAGRVNPRNVNIWEMRPEHEGPVREALAQNYGDFVGTFADALRSVATRLVGEYYEDNARDIRYSAEGSFLEDYDDLNLGVAFLDAATIGVTYCMMARCGLDTGYYFEDEDFQSVFDFNTESAIYALGTAVSEISERVLREIEVTVKKHERQIAAAERGEDYERNNGDHLQPEWGLPAARSGDGRGAGDGAADEVRHHAPELPQTAQAGILQFPAAERDAARSPDRDSTGGGEPDGADDGTARVEEPAPGQGSRSNEMGSAHEQPAADSRGNDAEGTDLHLGEPGPEPEAEAENITGTSETPSEQGGVFVPLYKYYSTQRPVDISTYPRDTGDPTNFFNFDERTWVENDTFRAWGYLIYDHPLTDKQISDYELRAAPDNPVLAIDRDFLSGDTVDEPAPDNPAPVAETYSQLGNTSGGAVAEPAAPVPEEPAAVPAPPVSAEPPDIPAPPATPPPAQTITPSTLGGVTISATLTAARTAITLDDVDMALRDGGNERGSLYRITAFYMKDKGPQANTDFLSREFLGGRYGHMRQSGKGFQTGDAQLSVWYSENGLTLCRGNAARYERGAVTIPWEQAAARVGELLVAGRFASPEVLGGAIGNEYHELADRLLFFYRDDLRDFRDTPEGWRCEPWKGWPDDVENLAGLLGNPEERGKIAATVEADIAALYTEEHAPMRFWHSPERLLAAVRDTLLPLRSFPVAELPATDLSRFITEDEVDQFFTRGGPYSEGKLGTLSFFLHNHTAKEQADFVKKRYKDSGQSDALGADDSWYDGFRGSIKLTRGNLSSPYSTVDLKWPKAAARIKKLIADGRYMTRAELDRIPEYERTILARTVNNFFGRPYDKTGWPFPEGISLHYPHEEDHAAILDFLNNRPLIEETLAAMQAKLDEIGPDDSHYAYKKSCLDTLAEYANGVYTLFPGLESVKTPEAAAIRPAPDFAPVVAAEQLSLFSAQTAIFTPTANLPGVAAQREAIETAEAEERAAEPVTITQADIEDALRRWNGSEESKFRVVSAMLGDSRSRAVANLLQNEYGGDQPTLTVTKDGAEPLALPWPRVQRYLAAMIEGGRFLTPEEQARYDARGAEATEAVQAENENANRPEAFHETRPVGQSVLLPTVYDDHGNFNRKGKRRRVTVAEPIGKYQIYTQDDQYGQPQAYIMTGSGRLLYWGGANDHNLTEEGITQNFADAVSRLEDALADPAKWADFNAAAIADRLDEAEAHNAPVREAREAQYEAERLSRVAANEAEAKAREEAFNNAVDGIAHALVNSELATIPRDFDKNPLLALFALYEIDVPLATKGWINRHVRAFQLGMDGRLMVRGSAKEITNTFTSVLLQLRVDVERTPIEQRRAIMNMSLDDLFRGADDERDAGENAPAPEDGAGETTAEPAAPEPQDAIGAETYSQPENTPEPAPPFTDAEIDALLSDAVGNPETREKLHQQFTEAPRSREAARLLREVYGGNIAYLTPRTDGRPGNMGLLSDGNGVVLSKGASPEIPLSERPPAESITLTWPKLHQRVAALAAEGRFSAQEQARPGVEMTVELPDTPEAPEAAAPEPQGEAGADADTPSGDGMGHVPPFTDEEVNVLIAAAVKDPDARERLHRQFAGAPRSREAARLLREVYGAMRFTMRRMDDPLGYMGILSENTGLALVKGAQATAPLSERPLAATLNLTWPKLHQRVATLAAEGRFMTEQGERPAADAPETERGRPYAVGDTVYIEAKPYVIERISDISGEVTLQDPSLVYPISRVESKERFEALLRHNERNRHFYDYVSADLDRANGDLIDVLENGMLTPASKETLTRMIAGNEGNHAIALYLSATYMNQTDTMTLQTGHPADFFPDANGLSIEIQDRFHTAYGFTWAEVAPVVRALHTEGRLAVREPELDADAERPEPVLPLIEQVRELMLQEGVAVSDELIEYAVETLGDGGHTAIAVAEKLEEIMASDEAESWGGDYPDPADRTDIGADADGGLQNPTAEDEARLETLFEEAAEAAARLETETEQAGDGGAPLSYDIGDIVYLENNTAYRIYDFDDFEVRLRERGTDNPRFLSVAEFERLLRQNPANAHLYEQPEPEEPARPAVKPVNFHITDDHLGEGGPKTKYGFNAAAIRTLKQVEAEGRYATPEEQEILSRFVGWGGIPQAFDPENESWAREYAELKDLLTPDEYEMARASTVNAHYTTPVVIRAMYDTLERLGFSTGNILEPSCGVGNFFGLLPRSMNRAKLYGVELDGVSGRIASLLYPNADVQVAGFEQTDMPDAFFDAVIGNVPFGDYPVADTKYKQNFNIHEYFFAKALDQVRPGGVVAFITSKYLMDKQNSNVRKYIAQRAELLGAVRLPNDAFLKNAGTETTTDIIFLQRRDSPIDIDADWAHLGQMRVESGQRVSINSYFAEHPEMILGKMGLDQRMNDKYGRDDVTACLPLPGAVLGQQLRVALANISGQISEPEVDGIEGAEDASIPADLSVRNFSYAMIDGALYYRENSRMYPIEVSGPDYDRLAGMIALRDCCHELITLQLDEHEDSEIRAKQAELGELYDAFAAEHGLLNSAENARAFSGDSAYYLLCSLEILDDDGNFERKADMFTKRTIKAQTVITSVDTAAEALAVSIGERASVDLGFMAQLMGGPEHIPDIVRDLSGVIYKDPNSGPFVMDGLWYAGWKTADEYLSGNVREKLKQARLAAGQFPEFAVNVQALEQAQPVDLEAGDISVRLGATWIDKSYVQQFMYHLLQSPNNIRQIAKVNFFDFTGEWQVTGHKRIPYSNVAACVTYGTKRANAYKIIEDTLNLRDVRIYDEKELPGGKTRRVLNVKETTIAQQRQELIRQKFKEWIWQDPERRRTLVALYNRLFNSTRPREYDGSHITFSGMNIDITLRDHQRAAVARAMYGGNSLLAHDVGAGKTFEMAAAAMESKRLGLCQKSLIAVPNHLPGDFAAEFLRLYPSANLLVVTKKDFEPKNRRKFCARIATGDYDAIIIGHSQIEKIPISLARQERLIQEQISDITAGIRAMKGKEGQRFQVKQLEKTKKRLEARLERLVTAKTRDDVVSFEQLGVDRLFVDEAHNYKNLFLYTKMRNVAGLSTADAQKSSDLFQKCRYLDEVTGGKGVIFATGTPISNSMTEMYTMQRYLQYDALQRRGMAHFDSWASTFGETRTSVELAPEGSGYRARTRFARFENLPELMGMFKETADIKTAEMMDLPRPDANYHTIVAEPTDAQKEMVAGLSERARLVHNGGVDPTVDNMLAIITDGRKIGLDQRIANPLLPDDPKSKVNLCAENITRIWGETREKRLTQMVFCDYSTPKINIWVADKNSTKSYAEQMKAIAGAYLAGKCTVGKGEKAHKAPFNVYDDVKAKLILKGIPPEEIAFIHDADTDEQKQELFAKVRKGLVRVLFGSTPKVGVGTNVQDRLIALHDLDCPWRPADLQQRAGRIVRFGNENPEVDIYRYVTNGTFDSYLWQTLENKQRFISQIMTGKSPVRTCEDVDEVMFSYAEIKAMCAGDPRIKEKMDLDLDVARLRIIKAEHQNTHFRLQDDLFKHFPESIEAAKERITGYGADIKLLEAQAAALAKPQAAEQAPAPDAAEVKPEAPAADAAPAKPEAPAVKPDPPAFPPMTVLGVTYTDREKAGEAILAALGEAKGKEQVSIGSYRGFDMRLSFSGFEQKHILTLKGAMSYSTELGGNASGNITRINNALSDIPERLKSTKAQLDNLYQQVDSARAELKRPFPQEAELAEKEARLSVLNVELNIDGRVGQVVESGAPEQSAGYAAEDAIPAKSARPSIIEGLRTGMYGGGNIRPDAAPDKAKPTEITI